VLVADEDVRASLAAIGRALVDGGRFAFETRNPRARAWEEWKPENAMEVVDPAGRRLRVSHNIEAVAGDVVTFAETTADLDGTSLRVDRASLRFLDIDALGDFLAKTGFLIEAQCGRGTCPGLVARPERIETSMSYPSTRARGYVYSRGGDDFSPWREPVKERLPTRLASLSAKYIALFALLVGVPVIGTSVYLLYSSYQDSKRGLIRLQQEKATSVAATIDQFFKDLTDRLGVVQMMYLSHDARASELQQLLSREHATVVFYIDRAGRKTVATPGGGLFSPKGNFSNTPSFVKAKATGIYFGPADAPQRLSNPRVRSMQVTVREERGAHSAFGRGVHAGVVGMTLDLAAVQDLVAQARLGTSGYVYAVDSRGGPIAHPSLAAFTHRSLALPQVTNALGSSSRVGSTVGHNFRRQRVLSVWATVEPVGWKVFVEQPESEAFAPIRGKIWRTALLLAGFVAAGIVLSVFLARRLVRPIERMQTAAARIGAGAYEERIELDRRDELGGLADELNRMAASLQELVKGLEQKVAERTNELQQALAELSQKSSQLEIASKHKSDFLANMSHELRTPLNAIIGFSQVLQQKLVGEINEKQEEYLNDVLSSAGHLLTLINDILDLSKVEAGHVELETATFSLREALERGIVMVRERATKNGVQLALEVDPEIDLVDGDERRIRQVVFNLLSNAVKFTPEGGRIDITTARSDGEVRVAVADTGPGIARSDLQRIFEEFQQAQPDSEGTGLGLALSKSLVELHGGRMWVESEIGKGSTFVFTLPVGAA
jgi:signal transduction histidine kinase